ncbi:FMN-binding negative transcriptional regulator [Parapedobacter sp.]
MFLKKTGTIHGGQLANADEIFDFINRFSFGLLLSRGSGRIIGTHIPILSNNNPEQLELYTHIALANSQWRDIEGQEVLAVFTEPHAYISTTHYTKSETVPTWNYVAVHIYGNVSILHDANEIMELINNTVSKYEPAYHDKWLAFNDDFRSKMLKGIIAFRINVTEVQGKARLS